MRRAHQRPRPVSEPTVVIRAPREKPARPVATAGFAQRLALFVSGVDRARTDELLAGLASSNHKSATDFAREAVGWDSATRQGRMAVTFGNHPRAADRLKKLIADASPALQLAVFRRLAPWQQSLFPRLKASLSSTAFTPARGCLCAMARILPQTKSAGVSAPPCGNCWPLDRGGERPCYMSRQI